MRDVEQEVWRRAVNAGCFARVQWRDIRRLVLEQVGRKRRAERVAKDRHAPPALLKVGVPLQKEAVQTIGFQAHGREHRFVVARKVKGDVEQDFGNDGAYRGNRRIVRNILQLVMPVIRIELHVVAPADRDEAHAPSAELCAQSRILHLLPHYGAHTLDVVHKVCRHVILREFLADAVDAKDDVLRRRLALFAFFEVGGRLDVRVTVSYTHLTLPTNREV